MVTRSAFRDFLKSLRTRWKSELSCVKPLEDSFGTMMPKASTFYAGLSSSLRMHVFISFQHSSKAWQVGQFTVNIILSNRLGLPMEHGGPFAPDDGVSFVEGSYRIGSLLGRKDKWWHLSDNEPSMVIEAWRALSYSSRDTVIAEAIADVTRDVRAVLSRLSVAGSDDAQTVA